MTLDTEIGQVRNVSDVSIVAVTNQKTVVMQSMQKPTVNPVTILVTWGREVAIQ